MAPVAPTRPLHRKRHSHDGSAPSKISDEQKSLTTPRRASHPASARPQPPTLPTEPIQRTTSPASLSTTETSSVPSSPKPTRLGSALSFFRTHSQPHPTPDQRRRGSSAGSSIEDSHSGSGSGSSDGDSEAVPRRKLLGKRRDSSKSTSSSGLLCPSRALKKPSSPVTESPAYQKADLKKAVMFARAELMKQVKSSGKNALVLEG